MLTTAAVSAIGDQIQVEGSEELMLVTNIDTNTLTVVRGYAGTTPENLADNQIINILGNAALEGADKPSVRFTNRIRCGNYTQIFTAAVEVSGTDMAASQLGLADEMDYQKQNRLRELLRDLENTVINGGQPASNPQGSDSVRRSMKGIVCTPFDKRLSHRGHRLSGRATTSMKKRLITRCGRSGKTAAATLT